MTPIEKVYDAFLSNVLEDEWGEAWTEEEVKQDLNGILCSALPFFKFPKVDITIDGDNFAGDLGNQEIQIIASYMKCVWLNRCILTWENVKPLYEERDFSQANLIDKFTSLLASERKHAAALESSYYRSENFKPFDYTKLAKQ